VKTAIAFLRKVGIAVIPINVDKINMSKGTFADSTKEFTHEEMLSFMLENNLKRGRGSKVWYWVENIFKVFENEDRSHHSLQIQNFSSSPVLPELQSLPLSSKKGEEKPKGLITPQHAHLILPLEPPHIYGT
jgi:hypothetical protein